MKITIDLPDDVADLAQAAVARNMGLLMPDGSVNESHPLADAEPSDQLEAWLTQLARNEAINRAALHFDTNSAAKVIEAHKKRREARQSAKK